MVADHILDIVGAYISTQGRTWPQVADCSVSANDDPIIATKGRPKPAVAPKPGPAYRCR